MGDRNEWFYHHITYYHHPYALLVLHVKKEIHDIMEFLLNVIYHSFKYTQRDMHDIFLTVIPSMVFSTVLRCGVKKG